MFYPINPKNIVKTKLYSEVRTMQKLFLAFIIFITGCNASSKVTNVTLTAENHKDVFILSNLIRQHLIRIHARSVDVNEIVKNDTLNRLQNSFEKLELKPMGGYMLVSYKFSKARDNSKIELTAKEKEKINNLRWFTKKIQTPYDGEIQFQYGERGYHIRKIIVSKL